MPENNNAPRTFVSSAQDKAGKLDVASLVLLAVLMAAGFVLNITVGKALAITGIQPEFVISAYCLAILILRPSLPQSVLIGVLAATVIQLTTSVPGLEYLCDIPGGAIMFLFAQAVARRGSAGVLPLVGAFVTTTVSGLIFATVATVVVLGAAPSSVVAMLPVVFGTALANCVIVQVLYLPLKKAAKR
ncbi:MULTISPECIES: hypothetical protein [Olsenella]|uniref:hypothetical protein n=1 Tax=Olsenella TaxID=133925 RepID=UPI000782BDB7|nr:MULTISPECIES: hypothetical protein [Olsenella]KXB62645.1 hypothetical protein HMPREF1868_01308 [Olsenella sp. DNF00959]